LAVRKVLAIDISVRLLFEHPTIEALARHLLDPEPGQLQQADLFQEVIL
ncbi:MAG: acyl carrier protein, partial [Cytophagales bacterium]|nr:acyl carrier protein [Cytophagales bacterium]